MASKDQLIFEVKIVPDEGGLRNLSSRVSKEVGASSNLRKEIDATADEVKLLTKDLENLGARGERSAKELEQAYGELQARLDRLDGVTKKTVSAQSTLIGAQNRLAGSTGNYQKLQSNANQTLFSFGDIANDAQQFSFGFGQGLRAIGNNIGFVSEQFANINQKSGGLKNTFAALGQSLLGPGGIILGIQLAVTALTIFSSRAKEAEEETDKLKETVKDLSDEILNLDDINDLNTRALLRSASAQNVLATRFERYVDLLKSQGFTELAETYEEQAKQLREQAEQTTKRRQELVRIIQVQEGLTEAQVKNRFANIENNETQNEELEILIEQLELYAQQDGAIGLISGTLDQIVEKQRGQVRLERRNLELQREIGLITQDQFELESKRLDNRLLAIQIEAEERRKQAQQAAQGTEVDTELNIEQPLVEDKKLQEALRRQDKETTEDKIKNLNRYVDIYRSVNQKIKEINDSLAASTEAVNNQVIQGLQQVISGLLPSAKKSALILLGIQKALSIRKVISQGTEKIAELRSEQLKLSGIAQANAFINPLVAAAAGAGVASLEASIQGIRGSVAKNVGKIAAIGLAQGAAISASGGGGSGSSSGGGNVNSGNSREQGFSTETVPSNSRKVSLELSFEDGVDEVISVKAQRGANKRKRSTFFTVE